MAEIGALWKPAMRVEAGPEAMAEMRKQYAGNTDVRFNRKSVSFRHMDAFAFGTAAGEYSQCATAMVPLVQIHTDTRRFQNRKSAYSAESVARIVQHFDPNRLDPVVIWQEPSSGKLLMLSGHSRLEAHKQLKRTHIPAKFFVGTESEAIQFAKVDANRGATQENMAEDVQAYRLLRDGDAALGIAPIGRQELQRRFKGKWQKLEAYTHLNPSGTLMQLLANPDAHDQFKYLLNRAATIGILRKRHGQLTPLHEEEMLHYWWKSPKGADLSPDDFMTQVSRRIQRADWKPTEPLSLERAPTTGTDARADTRNAQARIYQLQDEEKRLRERLGQARTKAEKEALVSEIQTAIRERESLERGIQQALKSQTSMFGIGGLSTETESFINGFVLALGLDLVVGTVVKNGLVRTGICAALGYYINNQLTKSTHV